MAKRLVLAIVALFVLWSFCDFLIHGVILSSTYVATATLWRSAPEMKIWLIYLSLFIWSLAFAAVYTYIITPKNLPTALIFGFLLGLGIGIPMGFNTYATMPIPLKMAIIWSLGTMVKGTLGGLVVGLIVVPPKTIGAHIKYPQKASYAWITRVKETPFGVLLLLLFLLYCLLNIIWTGIYYYLAVLKTSASFVDYLYFSFITALTIGYGDYSPIADTGKLLVIIHGCMMAIYFACMIAILSVKMFFPRNTLVFSKQMFLNPKEEVLGVRIINTHMEKLINPDIRIFMTAHCVGNVISSEYRVATFDSKPYLGKHDFILMFSGKLNNAIKISDEWKKAKEYDRSRNSNPKSRFCITISITGTYGIQQMSYFKKYYPSDIVIGKCFKAIEYNEQDQRKRLYYTDFPDFWVNFDTILNLP